jgi:GcrA cell cycle regulator
MSAPTWTPEQDAELIRLRQEGAPYSEIGRTLGVGRNAAIGRAYRLQRAGVEFPVTPAKPRAVGKPRPKREPRMRSNPVRPVATALENIGEGRWDRSPEAERKAWRVIDCEVWQPLNGIEPVSLVDRAPCRCAWPVAGQGADTLACGEAVKTGSSYCPTHHRLAWIPLKTPKRVYDRRVERIAARC